VYRLFQDESSSPSKTILSRVFYLGPNLHGYLRYQVNTSLTVGEMKENTPQNCKPYSKIFHEENTHSLEVFSCVLNFRCLAIYKYHNISLKEKKNGHLQ